MSEDRSISGNSESILRAFIDGSSDSICIRDRERRILLWNESFSRGVKANCGVDVCKGMRAEDYVPADVFAKSAPQREKLYGALEGKAQQALFPFPCSDGGTRWFDVHWTPIRSGGEVVAVAEVARDITERKIAELELEGARRLLSEAQRIAHVGSWEWDMVTGALTWSDEVYRIFGLTPHSFAATYAAFMKAVHPDDRAAVEKAVDATVADRDAGYEIDHRIVRPDGTERIVHERGEVTYENDKPIRMIGTVQDITTVTFLAREAKEQREALARVDRTASMGQLTGSIAHELNQPLTGILSNAQAGELMIKGGKCTCDEMGEIIEDVISDAKRAGAVIRNLRELFRQQTGELEALDLNEVISDVLVILHSEFVVQEVKVVHRLSDNLPEITGNRIQLQQVIINLLMNAQQAICAKGKGDRFITIGSAVSPGESVKVWVEDTGPGIDEERIDHIFEPLATWKPGGMGMGLAISRSIIDAHCGRIWAENIKGGGAKIIFALPLAMHDSN